MIAQNYARISTTRASQEFKPLFLFSVLQKCSLKLKNDFRAFHTSLERPQQNADISIQCNTARCSIFGVNNSFQYTMTVVLFFPLPFFYTPVNQVFGNTCSFNMRHLIFKGSAFCCNSECTGTVYGQRRCNTEA